MNESEFVAGTLEWCNEKRAEKGLEALERLPKGKKRDTLSCPCGAATGLSVCQTEWYDRLDPLVDPLGTEEVPHGDLPEAVCRFVFAFDAGNLPQYDADLDGS